MSAHTSGPWKVIVLDGYTYVNPERESGQYALIAKVLRNKADNARLIAAAPDLLAALELVLPWAEQHIAASRMNRGGLEQARSALAKAKGE